MKKETKKLKKNPIEIFYKTANILSEMKIKDIEDVKNFYIEVNNLASEISLNKIFIEKLRSQKYNDNIKIQQGVIDILVYGREIKKLKLFSKKLLKEVSLSFFIKMYPQKEDEIQTLQKEAEVYFYSLNTRDEINEEDIEKTKKIKQSKVERVFTQIEISKDIKNLYKNIKFEYREGKGRLKIDKNKNWIDLGKYNTRTFKLVKYILEPTSKSKLIEDVFESIRILKDNKNKELEGNTTRSYELKKKIISTCVAELQKKAFLKGHIKDPVFNSKFVTITFY